MLNKKGDKAELDDDDDQYTLTPSTEAKYKKINEDYAKAVSGESSLQHMVSFTINLIIID